MKLNVFLFTNIIIDDPFQLPQINEHYNWIIINQGAISTYDKLVKLIRKFKPVVLCTTEDDKIWSSLFQLPYEYKKRWVHFNSLQEVKGEQIEYCYLHYAIKNKSSIENPLYSVISTTFHSGDKIFRPYNSLKSQTYTNWEWVLWDDSKEDHLDTWNQLLKFQDDDIRISCYRAPHHSSYIGEMKWRAAAMCKGDWIVEIDHDDIVDEHLFEWCNNAIKKYPDTDFICSSCVELHEGDEEPHSYGDFSAFGHAAYQKQWLRGKWHNVYSVPSLNAKTIRYIIGVPNHIRIWKRTFYEKIGKHNTDFPVVDDYELLLRTYINNAKCTFIAAPTYYQFRNRGGNNFTFLRNSLIQYLTKKSQEFYEPEIKQFLEKNNMIDFCKNGWTTHYKCWEKPDEYTFKQFYNIYSPYISPKTISIIIPVQNESSIDIIKSLYSIQKQTYSDFIIYIIGNKSNTLNNTIELIQDSFDISLINKIRWWNLDTELSIQNCLNYTHKMLIHTEWITYLLPGKVWKTDYLEITLKKLLETDSKLLISDSSDSSDPISIFNSIHHYDLLKIDTETNNKTIKNIYSAIHSIHN